jgi:hypothetical protein
MPKGRITEQGGNFLIRSAYRFLNAGMNVAILNARSSLTNSDRLSVGHAMYVTSAIAAARKRWSKAGTGGSVWLVGTSNGTISTFNVAARIAANASPPLPAFPDRPDGVVLTSPIVQGGTATVLTTTPPYNTAQLNIPVAVVSHTADPCTASDATLSQQFETALMSPRKRLRNGTKLCYRCRLSASRPCRSISSRKQGIALSMEKVFLRQGFKSLMASTPREKMRFKEASGAQAVAGRTMCGSVPRG